ncbi:type II toxin-antitoxin system RelE/ParE family toxin [Jiella sp. M17.18]|uniref:type II toxin-antitoxin system RelE/ParE family toxin n=1 Tax=Jiella sp. M17.18 TaxID=3234247 RepID=UPI0034DE6816
MPYRLTERAARDLEEILVEGILQFGPIQALRYQDSFRRTFELIADLPRVGRRSQSEDERRFVHGSHIIFYRIGTDGVVIESIEHGSTLRDPWGEEGP